MRILKTAAARLRCSVSVNSESLEPERLLSRCPQARSDLAVRAELSSRRQAAINVVASLHNQRATLFAGMHHRVSIAPGERTDRSEQPGNLQLLRQQSARLHLRRDTAIVESLIQGHLLPFATKPISAQRKKARTATRIGDDLGGTPQFPFSPDPRFRRGILRPARPSFQSRLVVPLPSRKGRIAARSLYDLWHCLINRMSVRSCQNLGARRPASACSYA